MTDSNRPPQSEETPRGYRGTTGRSTSSYSPQPDQARIEKSRQARQILSGSEVRPPARTGSSYPVSETALTQPQMIYAVSLGILLALAILLWLIFGMGVASIFFFLLALGLLGGWLAF
jgi:Flp pilus assembly protein TadB